MLSDVVVQIEITYDGWTNTHDGDCDGNKCSYEDFKGETRTFSARFTPGGFIEFVTECDENFEFPESVADKWFHNERRNVFNELYGRTGGYGYCDNSPEGEEKGIRRHEIHINYVKYTLVRIEY